MGTGTLTDRSSGQTIADTFFNDIHGALDGDFVGRNSSGVATTAQNLGTNALPWGSAYITSLILNGSAVDTSLLTAPKNRIVSGASRSASNQPQFITPNGAAASFILAGATTNLVLDINGTAATVSTDITKSSLTVGPSTTHTAAIDHSTAPIAADQDSTRTWGEYKAELEAITVDAMGAEFQTFIGQYQIIKIAGVATEYALAYIASTTSITDIYRGFFTDSSGAPVNRTAFTDNDLITVLSTAWVFVEDDGTTVDVTYTTPVKSFTSPTGPATGDYWEDLANETWKRYDGASWQTIDRTLVGVVGIDSANCVCARSFDFFAKNDIQNNAEFEIQSTSIVSMKYADAKVSVLGKEFNFGHGFPGWNITTDLVATADLYDATEQASTMYYAYLADTGEAMISDISPHYRPDLKGYFHPHLPARCIAEFYNDGSSNITLLDEMRFNKNIKEKTVFVKHNVATNTAGGTFTSGAWQTRTLNTEEQNGHALYSLSSNAVTLIPGRYIVEGAAAAHLCANNQLVLYNTSDSSFDTLGRMSRSDTPAASTIDATFTGHLNTVQPKVFEMQHRCQTTRATDGWGTANTATGSQNVVWAELKLKKIG